MRLGRPLREQPGTSRSMASVLAPVLLVFAVCVRAADDSKPGLNDTFLTFAMLEVGAVVSAAGLLWPDRFRWARRAAVGILGVAFLAYAGKLVFVAPGLAASWQSVLVVVVIGAPALVYAVAGRVLRAQPVAPPTFPGPPTPEERRFAESRLVAKTLAAKLEWLLATNPDLRREGELGEEGRGLILFPKPDQGGFDVRLLVEDGEVTIYAGGLAHFHFHDRDPDAAAAAAIACLRNLLGPDMRLREHVANGRPYRAVVEMRTPDGWRRVSVIGVLLWNPFARGSERVLQNGFRSGHRAGFRHGDGTSP